MKISHIKGNTHVIDTGIVTIPFYRLNDGEVILLDSGWNKDGEELRRVLGEIGFTVKGILNSHAHPDHMGNNQYFREMDGAVTAMSEAEAWVYANSLNLKIFYNILTIEEIEEEYEGMFHTPDILIPKGAGEIDLLGVNFKLLHFPGHSADQLAIITPDNIMYVGDLVLSERVLHGSKIPYDFYLKQDLESKARVKTAEADCYILAHAGIVENLAELAALAEKNIRYFKDKAREIYELAEDNSTMDDIFKKAKAVMRINITTPQRYAVVIRMLRSNVEYLEYKGYLTKVIDDGYIKYRKNQPDWTSF